MIDWIRDSIGRVCFWLAIKITPQSSYITVDLDELLEDDDDGEE
jgi:hypothetical protein